MSMSDEMTRAEMMCVIKNYRMQVEQLEATCRKLNEQPKSTPWWIYDMEIRYLDEALEEQKAITNQHKETIADRDREINHLRKVIQEHDELAKERRETIAERDAEIKQLRNSLQAYGIVISQRQQTNAEQAFEINHLRKVIQEHDELAKKRRETIAERDAEIKRLRKVIQEQDEPCPPLVYGEHHPCGKTIHDGALDKSRQQTSADQEAKIKRSSRSRKKIHFSDGSWVFAYIADCDAGIKCISLSCRCIHPDGREIDGVMSTYRIMIEKGAHM